MAIEKQLIEEGLIGVIPECGWVKIRKWYDKHCKPKDNWIFRAQLNHWKLETTLERACQYFNIEQKDKKAIESGLIRKFQRECHRFITNVPEDNDILAWLSLMQHYGAPTRLLDWTHSIYVALFFALEEGIKNKKTRSVVWALDHNWLVRTLNKVCPNEMEFINLDKNIQQKKAETFNFVFDKKGTSIICPCKPFHIHERLTIQQGVFLCPGDLSKPFIQHLAELLKANKKNAAKDPPVIKFVIKDTWKVKIDILRKLYRMNMHSATLFPGLDGFAKSLQTMLVYPEIVKGFYNGTLRKFAGRIRFNLKS